MEGVRLRLGSLGSPDARAAYLDELREYLRSHEKELSEEVRRADRRQPAARLRRGPRGHTQGDGATRRSCSTASTPRTPSTSRPSAIFSTRRASPTTSTRPWSAGSTTTRAPCSSSSASGSAPSRGSAAAAATTGWSSSSAARATPANGWAIGVERVALALGEEAASPETAVSSSSRSEADRERALALATELRRAGVAADLDLADRAVKGQMKQADRLGRPPRADPGRGRGEAAGHGLGRGAGDRSRSRGARTQ